MRPSTGWFIAIIALLTLLFLGNPAIALFTGTFLTLTLNKSIVANAANLGKYCLQTAIVLLGLKLNVVDLLSISADYTLPIAIYVLTVLGLGGLLGWALKVELNANKLMSSGTAICGGTTIASLSPIIGATSHQTGAALAIVFLLNALALFTFPHIGDWLRLSQEQFGVWVALAIHDTSSVVATAQIYGEEAARVATTLKLGRTLWLIPLILAATIWSGSGEAKMRLPGFILLFILASIIGSIVPLPDVIQKTAAIISSALLVAALFFIGTEISRQNLREIDARVLLQAIILWLTVVPATLTAVLYLV
ncbi:MAG: putative sulfate exporter family transporter [bacterium]|nr:putative sulfate exporter family transporter [Gammaproteobacteria bacterium]HIL98769.1 putative sulfate exporter family transporter [Pseudomonadales bacterium]